MKFAETIEQQAPVTLVEPSTQESERVNDLVQMPLGLLGFEQVKKYALLGSPDEEPFLRLKMMDDPRIAFLVISPFLVLPSYQPDISDEDVSFLGLENPTDALVLNIVTVGNNGHATVNLKGPVVINRRSLVAKQVIPLNAASYPVQHPLPVAA